MHSASPMASAAVVLAVGTRFSGHASSETWQSSATSAACASVDAGFPVMAMMRAPMRRMASSSLRTLLRLAAVGDREQHVVGLNDAEVAVGRFGRVKEEGRRAGAGQRRRHLSADDARLAHAGDDDPALALVEHPHRPVEAFVEPIDERGDRRGFRLQHAPRQ